METEEIPTEASGKKTKKKKSKAGAALNGEPMAEDKPSIVTNGEAVEDPKSEKKKKKEKRRIDQELEQQDGQNGFKAEQDGTVKKKKKKSKDEDEDGEDLQSAADGKKKKKKKSRSEDAE